MATSALCGTSGTVTGPGGATEVVAWEVTRTVEAVDATSMDSDGFVERLACLKGGSGSFTTIGAPASAVGATSISCKTAASGGMTISGAIILTSVGYAVDVNGRAEYPHTFVFTGPITAA
jgi:hypothetical protein